MMGVATSVLVAELLKAIARDGLYNAVLDGDDTGAMRPERIRELKHFLLPTARS